MSTSTINIVHFLKDYKNNCHPGKGGEGEAELWQRTKSAKSTIEDCALFVVVKTIRKMKTKFPQEVLVVVMLKQYEHPNIIQVIGYAEYDLISEYSDAARTLQWRRSLQGC
jgi:hypothetical protein